MATCRQIPGHPCTRIPGQAKPNQSLTLNTFIGHLLCAQCSSSTGMQQGTGPKSLPCGTSILPGVIGSSTMKSKTTVYQKEIRKMQQLKGEEEHVGGGCNLNKITREGHEDTSEQDSKDTRPATWVPAEEHSRHSEHKSPEAGPCRVHFRGNNKEASVAGPK